MVTPNDTSRILAARCKALCRLQSRTQWNSPLACVLGLAGDNTVSCEGFGDASIRGSSRPLEPARSLFEDRHEL
jgi:hypothetical protein